MAKKSKVTKRDLALFRKAMFAADGKAEAAGRKRLDEKLPTFQEMRGILKPAEAK